MTASVLVLCTANVCRSVYATAILDAAFTPAGITVASAGLTAAPNRPPCALVLHRTEQAELAVLQADSHQVSQADIADADLILVMTAPQRATVARLVPSARTKIFTLVEAAIISRALADQGIRCPSLSAYVAQLDLQRTSVDLPVAHERRRVFGIVIRRHGHVHTAIGIEDGHVSSAKGEHERSLDLVRRYADRLVAACSGQPWLAVRTADPTAREPIQGVS